MTIDFYLNRIICGDCLTVMREMQEKTYQLFNEDCRVGIKKLPDHSIDFIVTDLEERLTVGEALDFLDAVRRFLLNGKIDYVPIEDTDHENLAVPLACPDLAEERVPTSMVRFAETSPRRVEVEEALLQVSKEAREFYKKLYPFASEERFLGGSVPTQMQKMHEFVPVEAFDLVEAGLLAIDVRLRPVANDDEYRSWKPITSCPR